MRKRFIAIVCLAAALVSVTPSSVWAGSKLAASPVAVALNRETGEQVWRAENPGHGRWVLAGVQEGLVILQYGSCDYKKRQAVIALDQDTGEERWRIKGDPPDQSVLASAVGGKSLIVTSVSDQSVEQRGAVTFQGVEPQTGAVKWEIPGGGRYIVASSPHVFVVVDSVEYGEVTTPGLPPVTQEARELVAFDRATGKERWRYASDLAPFVFNASAWNLGHGVVSVDFLAFDQIRDLRGEEHIGLDIQTGRVLWTAPRQVIGSGRGDGTDDLVFDVTSDQGPLRALDVRTLEPVWSVDNLIAGSIYDDIVIAQKGPAASPAMVAVDKKTGRELWLVDRLLELRAAGHGVLIEIEYPAIAARGAGVTGIDARTGKALWNARAPGPEGKGWLVDKHVFAAFGGCNPALLNDEAPPSGG